MRKGVVFTSLFYVCVCVCLCVSAGKKECIKLASSGSSFHLSSCAIFYLTFLHSGMKKGREYKKKMTQEMKFYRSLVTNSTHSNYS